MGMREMMWGWLLTDVSPLAKLLAIRIGDLQFVEYEATPLSIDSLASFSCSNNDDTWKAIYELVQKTGLEFVQRENAAVNFYIPIEPEPWRGPKGPDVSPLTIYVMACGDRTKVGISRDADRRRLNLQGFNALPVTLEWKFSGPAHQIRRAERASHQFLAGFRIHGEWYATPAAFATGVVMEKIKESGLQ